VDETIAAVRDWLIAHADWIGPVVSFTAFGESLPIVGVALPGSTFLMAAGTLIPLGIIDAWSLMAWVVPGAILGDVVAFWLGRRFGQKILGMWPMRNHPELIEQGYRFFKRWGTASVFVGRFSGPMRSTMPLLAGMMGMPRGKFMIANVASALAWAPFLMSPGFLMAAGAQWMETATPTEKLVGGLILVNLVVGGIFLWRWNQRRLARMDSPTPEPNSNLTKD
jgi:membrane protein DedA with SNARE-associated domain